MVRRTRSDELFNYDDLNYEEMERLARDGIVNIEPPINSDFLFDPQFDNRATSLNRKPYRGAQIVSPIEQRVGPWDGNAQLGTEVAFSPDPNLEQTILKMSTWGMPQVWTLGLGLDADNTQAGIAYGVTALISFGSGGATQELEIDWLAGSGISLPLNAINVNARYQSFLAIPTNLRLRATLSRGSNALIAATRTYEWIVDVAVANSNIITIPPFARRLRVMPAGRATNTTNIFEQGSGNAEVRFSAQDGAAGDIQAIDASQLLGFSQAGGIPIPSIARAVYIRNLASATAMRGYFVFDIGV